MNRWINCRMKWNYHLPDGKKGANVVLVDKFQALAVIPLSLVETRVRERERARISLEFLRCPRRYNPLVRRKLSLTTSCSFARSPSSSSFLPSFYRASSHRIRVFPETTLVSIGGTATTRGTRKEGTTRLSKRSSRIYSLRNRYS